MDIEASGFGPFSYPIEVGLALSNCEKYASLIKPEPAWTHWDFEAEKVHCVSREILCGHGKPCLEVANQLNCLLAGKVVYSDGWVVDKTWLSHLFYKAKIAQLFVLSPLENILSEYQMQHWAAVKAEVIAELQLTRHRASSDALIIQETYRRSLLCEL